MVITAPNGQTTTMGEFRAVFFERQRELDEQAGALGKGRLELAEVFQGLMAEKEKLAADRAAFDASRASVANGWNNDANGAGDRLAVLETTLAELKASNIDLSKKLEGASTQFVFDRMRDEFDGETLPTGMTQKDVMEYAQKRGLKRGWLPDIKAALHELRAPAEIETKLKKAEQDGYERAQKEMSLRSIHGNSRTITMGKTDDTSPVKITPGMDTEQILDASVTAAAGDQEIRGMLAGVIPAPGA
jgi:hypothetical protein